MLNKDILIGVTASIATALLLLANGLIGSNEIDELDLKNSVIAFNQEACPEGWNDFEPAYGRFVRGIDRNKVALDPAGERAVTSLQLDSLAKHNRIRYCGNLESVNAILCLLPNRSISVNAWVEPRRSQFMAGDIVSFKVSLDKDAYLAVFVDSMDGSTYLSSKLVKLTMPATELELTSTLDLWI